MKKSILLVAVTAAMALAGTAGAALVPGVYDPGTTGCPVATYASGVLHLEKNCDTSTNASAGADITGFVGQTFTSATFTLASAAQCQGGSPRFNIVTSTGTFFLGCNNVTPTVNGTALTYLFDATTIAALAQVAFPIGTITSVEVLIDNQGSADLSNIAVNEVAQVPATTTGGGSPATKADCKHGGWKTFTNPSFGNQGRCVSWVNHQRPHGKHAAKTAETSQAHSASDDETTDAQATADTTRKAEHGRNSHSKGGKHGK